MSASSTGGGSRSRWWRRPSSCNRSFRIDDHHRVVDLERTGRGDRMGGVEGTAALSVRRTARRSRIWLVVRWAASVAAVVVAAIVVAGKRAEFAGATNYLDHLRAWWIAFGFGCEVLAIAA